MNYPSYQHIPADPAVEAKDAVWVLGTICPNQFTDETLDDVEAFDYASIDNWMPILNAEVNAQLIADKFGIPVVVTLCDEGDWNRGGQVFSPALGV